MDHNPMGALSPQLEGDSPDHRRVDDTRDVSWRSRSAPPPPVHAQRLLWRVKKSSRFAEARIRDVPDGSELRIVVGGAGRAAELLWSCVYRRAAESTELATTSVGVLQDFKRLGWVLISQNPGPH